MHVSKTYLLMIALLAINSIKYSCGHPKEHKDSDDKKEPEESEGGDENNNTPESSDDQSGGESGESETDDASGGDSEEVPDETKPTDSEGTTTAKPEEVTEPKETNEPEETTDPEIPTLPKLPFPLPPPPLNIIVEILLPGAQIPAILAPFVLQLIMKGLLSPHYNYQMLSFLVAINVCAKLAPCP